MGFLGFCLSIEPYKKRVDTLKTLAEEMNSLLFFSLFDHLTVFFFDSSSSIPILNDNDNPSSLSLVDPFVSPSHDS